MFYQNSMQTANICEINWIYECYRFVHWSNKQTSTEVKLREDRWRPRMHWFICFLGVLARQYWIIHSAVPRTAQTDCIWPPNLSVWPVYMTYFHMSCFHMCEQNKKNKCMTGWHLLFLIKFLSQRRLWFSKYLQQSWQQMSNLPGFSE